MMIALLARLPSCPGTYLLHFRLPDTRCRIGALGECELPAGDYVYVGSAFGPGGVAARLRHHLASQARPRWHLDYLRGHMTVSGVWFTCDARRREALWSRVLAGWSGARQPVPGFGASDRPRGGGVQSHLFLLPGPLDAAGFQAAALRRAPRHGPIYRETVKRDRVC